MEPPPNQQSVPPLVIVECLLHGLFCFGPNPDLTVGLPAARISNLPNYPPTSVGLARRNALISCWGLVESRMLR